MPDVPNGASGCWGLPGNLLDNQVPVEGGTSGSHRIWGPVWTSTTSPGWGQQQQDLSIRPALPRCSSLFIAQSLPWPSSHCQVLGTVFRFNPCSSLPHINTAAGPESSTSPSDPRDPRGTFLRRGNWEHLRNHLHWGDSVDYHIPHQQEMSLQQLLNLIFCNTIKNKFWITLWIDPTF